jgi:hypothetical protein
VHGELAVELLGILVPLLLVEEVLIGSPAAVEERDAAPVVEGIGAILLN